MDELELLKKDWQKQGDKFPKLSHSELYGMLLKKSSSIVKWIFIISLLEFVFWTILSISLKGTESMARFDAYGTDAIFIGLSVVSYIILGYFFYRFYMNYKNISATDDVRSLMKNILRTRKTVKQYVGFNLIFLFISTFTILGIQFNKDEQMLSVIEQASANGELFKFYATTILATLLVLGIAIGLILLLYYLIYGILLKRLNKNYNELKKLEV
jgi:hypothetical protein